MLRKGITAALLAGWLATPVQAGLQSALTTALTGLQAAETVTGVTSAPIATSQIITFAPAWLGIDTRSYEDFLFIDPVAFTRTNPVYRNGPELIYDSLTGGLTIVAPPLLGPADEFGTRQTLAPRQISVHANGYLADGPVLAHVKRYGRNRPTSLGLTLQTSDGEDELSFRLASQSRTSLDANNGVVRHDINSFAGFSGTEIRLPGLLPTGLDSEFYDDDLGFIPGINLWPSSPGRLLYGPFIPGAGPDVHITVRYGLSTLRFPGSGSFIFLAVPKVIPEPATSLFVLMASTMLLSRRTRRD